MSFWLHQSRIKQYGRMIAAEISLSFFITLFLLTVFLLAYIFVFPLWRDVQKEHNNVEQLVLSIQHAKHDSKARVLIDQRIASSKAEIKDLLEPVKDNRNPVSVLVHAIDEKHITCHNVQIFPTQCRPLLTIVPVAIQATSSFGNIFSFFQQLQNNKQGLFCQSLVLKKQTNRSVGIDAKFYVTQYVEP